MQSNSSLSEPIRPKTLFCVPHMFKITWQNGSPHLSMKSFSVWSIENFIVTFPATEFYSHINVALKFQWYAVEIIYIYVLIVIRFTDIMNSVWYHTPRGGNKDLALKCYTNTKCLTYLPGNEEKWYEVVVHSGEFMIRHKISNDA